MVRANDDELRIDACIGWPAICEVARVSLIECEALRPLPRDADGISAEAIFQRTLVRSGREVATIVTQKIRECVEPVRARSSSSDLARRPDCVLSRRARETGS